VSNVAGNTNGVVIGVYFENEINIQGFTLPLEVRSAEGSSAYITTTGTFTLNPDGRIYHSPLGPEYDNFVDSSWPGPNVTSSKHAVPAANSCSGNKSSSWTATAGNPDGISPDAFFYTSVSTGDPGIGQLIYLSPGADPDGTPSMRLTVNVNNTTGIFEIDTCCKTPGTHIAFVDDNVQIVVPQFVMGRVGINTILGVKELETGTIPDKYELEQNYPNPFNAGTVIRFSQPVYGKVSITVYNILGAKVRTLVDEFRVAGLHQTDWDGKSDDGQRVASGVYFYRIVTEGYTSTRKMVLMK
jgi:hypothetical protein